MIVKQNLTPKTQTYTIDYSQLPTILPSRKLRLVSRTYGEFRTSKFSHTFQHVHITKYFRTATIQFHTLLPVLLSQHNTISYMVSIDSFTASLFSQCQIHTDFRRHLLKCTNKSPHSSRKKLIFVEI